MKTAQHVQLEVPVQIQLGDLFLAQMQHMLKRCQQNARFVQQATAALTTKEHKYVPLKMLLDIFTAQIQWFHVHSVQMQAQGKYVNHVTSCQ